MVVVVALDQQHSISVRGAPVDGPIEVCVNQVVEYLGSKAIPGTIQVLVDESRKFYPDFSVLLGQEPIKMNYVEAMEQIGPQIGCHEVEEIINRIGKEVPCYRDLAVKMIDVVNARNQRANEVIEADYVCQMALL